jgi:4-hydroxyphenylpyruvate dioxygenase
VEKIFLAQIADAPQPSVDVLSWSRHFRNFPRPGTVVGRRLCPRPDRRPLSLEIFNDEFRAAPARLIARAVCALCCW